MLLMLKEYDIATIFNEVHAAMEISQHSETKKLIY